MNQTNEVKIRERILCLNWTFLNEYGVHLKKNKSPLVPQDFREAVGTAATDDGEPALDEKRLCEILNELPDIYLLHRTILTELETRTRQW